MCVSSDPADLYHGTKKYINVIGEDTESEIVDLPNMIRDKQLWHDVVRGISFATA